MVSGFKNNATVTLYLNNCGTSNIDTIKSKGCYRIGGIRPIRGNNLVFHLAECKSTANRPRVKNTTTGAVDYQRAGRCIKDTHTALTSFNINGTIAGNDISVGITTAGNVILSRDKCLACNQGNSATTTGTTISWMIAITTGDRE